MDINTSNIHFFLQKIVKEKIKNIFLKNKAKNNLFASLPTGQLVVVVTPTLLLVGYSSQLCAAVPLANCLLMCC